MKQCLIRFYELRNFSGKDGLSREEKKKQGRFVRIRELELTDKQAVRGWLKGFEQGVLLVRRVFTNKDGSTGLLNPVCSDLACDGEQVATIYQKRKEAEEFHQSLKGDGIGEIPNSHGTTQNTPVFMAIYAVFKLATKKARNPAFFESRC